VANTLPQMANTFPEEQTVFGLAKEANTIDIRGPRPGV
jgi:hypothetical protein